MYKPQPIDTSDVRLSEDMLSLIEKLAEIRTTSGQKEELHRAGHTAKREMTN